MLVRLWRPDGGKAAEPIAPKEGLAAGADGVDWPKGPTLANNGAGSGAPVAVCTVLPLCGLYITLSGDLGVLGLASTAPASSAAAGPMAGVGTGDPVIELLLLLLGAAVDAIRRCWLPAGVVGKLRVLLGGAELLVAGGDSTEAGEYPCLRILCCRSRCSCAACDTGVLPAVLSPSPATTAGGVSSEGCSDATPPALPSARALVSPVNIGAGPLVADAKSGSLGLLRSWFVIAIRLRS